MINRLEQRLSSEAAYVAGFSEAELTRKPVSDNKKTVNQWLSVNQQTKNLVARQTKATLSYKIVIEKGHVSDLRFLIADYLDHLGHHLNQVAE